LSSIKQIVELQKKKKKKKKKKKTKALSLVHEEKEVENKRPSKQASMQGKGQPMYVNGTT
jgi:hypothetical protein